MYGQSRKTDNNMVCFKESTFNEFEADLYEKLKEIIELQYDSKHNSAFYSNVIGMIPLTEKLE